MKFEAKESTNMQKPLIKKGYYPAKLMSIKQFKDSEGKLMVDKKWGSHKIILEFLVYKGDEKGHPTSTLEYNPNPENDKVTSDVLLSQFITYEYPNKNDKEEPDGTFRTALTPGGIMAKAFEALGWVFDGKGLEGDSFIGNWVELNVDDYTRPAKDGYPEKTFSIISKINKLKGHTLEDETSSAGISKTPIEPKPTVTTEKVNENTPVNESTKKIEELNAKLENLEKLKTEGFLTTDGLAQAKEQIKNQIKELQ